MKLKMKMMRGKTSTLVETISKMRLILLKMVRLMKLKMMRGKTSTLVETISNMRLIDLDE